MKTQKTQSKGTGYDAAKLLDYASDKATGKVIAAMLSQNTGTHFLDSGGAYGRHWERNQKIDLAKEPSATLEIDAKYKEISVTLSLYHFLTGAVTYLPNLDAAFQEFAEQPEYERESWEDTLNAFVSHLQDSGIDTEKQGSFYTYNHDNLLGQDFVAHEFELDGTECVFIQSHNGCDARGGFSTPHAFLKHDYDTQIYDYDKATISCSEGHWWDIGSYSDSDWRNDDGLPDLEDFDIISAEELENEQEENGEPRADVGRGLLEKMREFLALRDAPRLPTLEGTAPAMPGDNRIIVEDNGTAHCPICGAALTAYGSGY